MGPPSRVGMVPLGGSGGTRPPPGWPLWPLSPKAPLEIFLKPLKTFHSDHVKVPRPLVALALAKNLDSVGGGVTRQST